MTSHQQYVLSNIDITCLKMLAIRHPEKDQTLLSLYHTSHLNQPRDKNWHIVDGPPTKEVEVTAVQIPSLFKFMVQKGRECMAFEYTGYIHKTLRLGSSGNEWLLVTKGTLWRYCVGNADNIKAENATIPCYYNSHARKGFGLVPLITSYEVYGANTYELQTD